MQIAKIIASLLALQLFSVSCSKLEYYDTATLRSMIFHDKKPIVLFSQDSLGAKTREKVSLKDLAKSIRRGWSGDPVRAITYHDVEALVVLDHRRVVAAASLNSKYITIEMEVFEPNECIMTKTKTGVFEPDECIMTAEELRLDRQKSAKRYPDFTHGFSSKVCSVREIKGKNKAELSVMDWLMNHGASCKSKSVKTKKNKCT